MCLIGLNAPCKEQFAKFLFAAVRFDQDSEEKRDEALIDETAVATHKSVLDWATCLRKNKKEIRKLPNEDARRMLLMFAKKPKKKPVVDDNAENEGREEEINKADIVDVKKKL